MPRKKQTPPEDDKFAKALAAMDAEKAFLLKRIEDINKARDAITTLIMNAPKE